MDKTYRVAGYVKLAKLWEKSREKAVTLHNSFFQERYRENPNMQLVGVYVDITGNKNTYKRPEMVRLINDCRHGLVDVIVMQTRAYFAANSEEMCYLFNYLFTLPYRIDIITDDTDGRIDTILNVEKQREIGRAHV